MKILIATPDFPLLDGGLSTSAMEIAYGFHRLGHQIVVQTPTQVMEDKDFDRTLPFDVFRLINIKDRYIKIYYHTMKMAQLMKKYRFDYIFAHSWYPSGVAAAQVSQRYSIKMGVMVHGNDILSPRFSAPFWHKKKESVFNIANHIFCNSNFNSHKLQQILSSLPDISRKIMVSYCGVDHKYFSPASPDESLLKRYDLMGKSIILTLARLVERKGQDMVIRDMPEIKRYIPNVKYLVCGKGNYEEKLKAMVTELDLVNDVIFAGPVAIEERNKYYNLCDLFIMPSREIIEKGDVEGFGITYLEANACEKPVIGGNSGGATDAIVNGETGFLVDPQNYVEISQKCIELLSNRNLSEKMGKNGRKRVIQTFNWDSICRNIIKFIQ